MCFELSHVMDAVLLGSSGGVVNSLDFYLASLKSLGCFYFRCILYSQWKVVKRIKMNTLPWYHAAKVQYSTMIRTRSKHIKGSNECYFSMTINRWLLILYSTNLFAKLKTQCTRT